MVDYLSPDQRAFLKDRPVTTSFIQRLPLARHHFRKYLALMPMAVEQFDLSAFDLVISSSHAVAKGVLTHSGQLHISYVHTPMRYAWDLQEQYLAGGQPTSRRKPVARALLHYMRVWDARTANGVDEFVVNSSFVARRVWKIYRRKAHVVYPPVDVDSFEISEQKGPFYLTVSRLVPYKRVDLIVDAFSKLPGRRLIVIGDGPEFSRLKSKAASNVTMLGYQPFQVIREHMQRAQAFLFAAEEDFGIAPVEAQACGTPVVALARGGATETVIDEHTGLYFAEPTVESLVSALHKFENIKAPFDPNRIRHNAERFGIARFRREFSNLIEREYAEFLSAQAHDHSTPLS